MADQNDQQSPPQPAPSVPAVTTQVTPMAAPAPTEVQKIEADVKQGFKATVSALWDKYGIFFILVGIGLIVVKYNEIVMDYLGWSSKKTLEDAQKTDTKLKAEEDAANQQANDLVKQANDLPNQEGVVDDDWDKKGS